MDPPLDLHANWQSTQRKHFEYAVCHILIHKGSGDVLCYRVCRYEYSPEHDALGPTEYLPQHSLDYYWKEAMQRQATNKVKAQATTTCKLRVSSKVVERTARFVTRISHSQFEAAKELIEK